MGNERFRRQLRECIVRVFALHPEWQYFQGVHDLGAVICSVFYRRSVEETSLMLEHLLATFMIPFLTQPLDVAFQPCFLNVIHMLHNCNERQLASIVASTDGMWMLSWILTWFAHSRLDSCNAADGSCIFSLFEAVLQSKDVFFVEKVAVALLILNKKRIIEAANAQPFDEGELFALLQNLPKNSDFSSCVQYASSIPKAKKPNLYLYLSISIGVGSIAVLWLCLRLLWQ